jgi:hypothetical protein
MLRTAVLVTPMVYPFIDRIIDIKRQFWDYPLASQRTWFRKHVEDHDLHVLGL